MAWGECCSCTLKYVHSNINTSEEHTIYLKSEMVCKSACVIQIPWRQKEQFSDGVG
jgi:hypothetical protein